MKDVLVPNFDAWSQLDAASLPMPKTMVDNLLLLDTADLLKAAKAAGQHSAKLTGAEGMELNADQLALLRINTEMLKRALQAATNANLSPTPRDLSSLMKKIGADFLDNLGEIHKQDPEGWQAQVDALLDDWGTNKVAPWVAAIQAVSAARTTAEQDTSTLVATIIEGEDDLSSFDEPQARLELATAQQSIATLQAIPELTRLFDEKDRADQLKLRLDDFSVRLEALAAS